MRSAAQAGPPQPQAHANFAGVADAGAPQVAVGIDHHKRRDGSEAQRPGRIAPGIDGRLPRQLALLQHTRHGPGRPGLHGDGQQGLVLRQGGDAALHGLADGAPLGPDVQAHRLPWVGLAPGGQRGVGAAAIGLQQGQPQVGRQARGHVACLPGLHGNEYADHHQQGAKVVLPAQPQTLGKAEPCRGGAMTQPGQHGGCRIHE